MTAALIVIGGVVWTALAIGVGVLIGKSIRLADRQQQQVSR